MFLLTNSDIVGLQLGSGEKTVLSEVTAGGKQLAVTITKEGRVVQEWILRQKGKDFGLDVEWRPNFMKSSSEHKVALLQVPYSYVNSYCTVTVLSKVRHEIYSYIAVSGPKLNTSSSIHQNCMFCVVPLEHSNIINRRKWG